MNISARAQIAPAIATVSAAAATNRIVTIDAWRGIVLALMALEHAGSYLQAYLVAETYLGNSAEIQSWPGFVAGLFTNLAAPTFWLLAGVSVALLEASRRRSGASQKSITHFLLVRSLVLIVVDLTVCSLIWPDAQGNVHVLLSLGVSLAFLSALRLLPLRWIGFLSLFIVVGYQWFLVYMPSPTPEPQNLLTQLFFIPSYSTWPAIEFPVAGWCGIMFAGYWLGRHVSSSWLRRSRAWLLIGLSLLLGWLVLRLSGGFGDYLPYSADTPWYYFFVMSKAPASLTYLFFNLGLSFILFSILLKLAGHVERQPGGQWLIALGQVSLFVYVLHLAIYRILGALFLAVDLPLPELLQVSASWLLGLAALISAAYAYRRFKKARPSSVLRYF
jgi:uncharacterized membrane protein